MKELKKRLDELEFSIKELQKARIEIEYNMCECCHNITRNKKLIIKE